MSKKTVSPGGHISGVVELPGDKSISHRYAILAALAEGTSEIQNYSTAADCKSTLQCLRRLGIAIDMTPQRVRIAGKGLDGLRESQKDLDAENSGTTMRMLSGVLAGQPFATTITGDGSLRKRPMRRVIEPLRRMGAEIKSAEGDRAPLVIRGGKLKAIEYALPIPSAQVKSAVLLAGMYADGTTSVLESVRTRDHTELALREMGASIETTKGLVRIQPRPKLQARNLTVPGDLSAAVFMIAAALILPESSLMLHNVGLNPGRGRVLDFLISLGAPVNLASVQLRDGELIGDVAVHYAALKGGTVSGAMTAEMIDELTHLSFEFPRVVNRPILRREFFTSF